MGLVERFGRVHGDVVVYGAAGEHLGYLGGFRGYETL